MQRRIWNGFCKQSACSVNVPGSFLFKIDGWCKEDESEKYELVFMKGISSGGLRYYSRLFTIVGIH